MEIDVLAELLWKRLDGLMTALYFTGSRVYNAHVPSSDLDFFGIVNDKYDFSKEEEFNRNVSEESGEVVNFRGLAWGELQGGEQKGIITKYVPLSVILRGFHLWVYKHGKRYTLDDFKVKPATPEEEFRRSIERLNEFRVAAEKGKGPLTFEYYIKTVLISIEAQQEMKGKPFTLHYGDIAEREDDPELRKLADQCMAFRNGKKIDMKGFFRDLDTYLAKKNC